MTKNDLVMLVVAFATAVFIAPRSFTTLRNIPV
jgi:hypothetical protein